MLKNMKLKTKLLTFGIVLTLLPLLLSLGTVIYQNRQMGTAAQEESTKLAYANLDHIAQMVYNLLQAEQYSIQENIN